MAKDESDFKDLGSVNEASEEIKKAREDMIYNLTHGPASMGVKKDRSSFVDIGRKLSA